MAEGADLWPDIEFEPIKTPASVLREQATLLGRKTGNLVTASVETKSDSRIVHSFFMECDAIQYKVRLLRVVHGVLIWPAEIVLDSSAANATVQNEEEFIAKLREVFASTWVTNIVRALMSQAAEDVGG